MSYFTKTTVLLVCLLFAMPVTAWSACSRDYADIEKSCDDILQSAYAPGMAVFNSCQSQCESDDNGVVVVKLIIKLQGGILGTPYVLKGRLIVDKNENLWKTRWAYWNSPLKPLNRTVTVESKKSKWDF